MIKTKNSTAAQQSIKNHYGIQFTLFILMIAGVLLFLAQISYSNQDTGWATASTSEIKNLMGSLGAYNMDFLYSCFGYIAKIIAPLLFLKSIYWLKYSPQKIVNWSKFFIILFGVIIFIISGSLMNTLLFMDAENYAAGGFVGSILSYYLATLLPLSLLSVLSKIIAVIAILGLITGFVMASGLNFLYFIYAKLYVSMSYVHFFIVTIYSKVTKNSKIREKVKILSEQNNFLSKVTGVEKVIPKIELNQDYDSFAMNNREVAIPLITKYLIVEEESEDVEGITDNNTRHKSVIDGNIKEEISPIGINLNSRMTIVKKSDLESLSEDQITKEYNKENGLTKLHTKSLIHPLLVKPKLRNKPTTPLPSINLLKTSTEKKSIITSEELEKISLHIEAQLKTYKITAKVKNVVTGPVVTRYEIELEPGVKASRVVALESDLARAMLVSRVRVVEVIAGSPHIGIELPNRHRQIVSLREIINSVEFQNRHSFLSIALGKDISGKPIIVDLQKMPHLLVAGATGAGKSVGINTMILSLLYKVTPEQVRFIMIDPKVVELSVYQGIPHLLTEVVTEMKKASNALKWCVDEMERRYQLLSALNVRNLESYNEIIDKATKMNYPITDPKWKPTDSMDSEPPILIKLPYIVVIVDEFADLMMVAGKKVEELIARLTQKARAIGIHIILATQRPSVDVITGLIKANIPSRIAFTVSSKIDSRTILDAGGAETLLGRGDMLYSGSGSTDIIRIHGAYMSDEEVNAVAEDWRARAKPQYVEGILDYADEEDENNSLSAQDNFSDPLYDEVVAYVKETGSTSTSSIQRNFSIGFNRAARMTDKMKAEGIIIMRNGKPEVAI